jgi:hypothetical protein
MKEIEATANIGAEGNANPPSVDQGHIRRSQMNKRYNYRNCQSLFGYAQDVHKRSGGICQLCGAGTGEPSSFDSWRQLTVEHLVGASQGGYLNEIRVAINKRFQGLSNEQREELALRIDRANIVTACSFCNSTTSRDHNLKNMAQLILEAKGEPDAAVNEVVLKLEEVLKRKRIDVRWKLDSIREAFYSMIKPELDKHVDRNLARATRCFGIMLQNSI